MGIGQRREQVHFEGSEQWDNYPSFATRLDHAFSRVNSFICDHRIIVPELFFFSTSICYINNATN